VLTAYLTDTRSLLQLPGTQSTSLYSDADLTRFINKARGQVAGEARAALLWRRAAVAYTMCICDRPNKDGSFNPGAQHPLPMPEALSEEEYNSLSSQANEFNFQCAMNAATVDQLVDILEKVLAPQQDPAFDEEGQGQGVVVGSDCDGNIIYDEEHGEEKG
jgi:hypothetical protein